MGIREGYRKGFDIVSDLSVRRYQKWFDLVTFTGAAAAGFCLIAALRWSWIGGAGIISADHPEVPVPIAVFGAAFVLTLAFLHFRISKHMTIFLAALLGILISLALSAM
jgi:hypothetical protein